MAEQAYAHHDRRHLVRGRGIGRALPAGSEVLIAVAFGAVGWYGIVHLVLWIVG